MGKPINRSAADSSTNNYMRHREIGLFCVPKVIMHFSKLYMGAADTDACVCVWLCNDNACMCAKEKMHEDKAQTTAWSYISSHLDGCQAPVSGNPGSFLERDPFHTSDDSLLWKCMWPRP